ncbi:MAG: beta-ketoacyl-ACP synthase III [Christensenellaceae bacterium]|jgi:3-oxoacyl-[acyl-carrier-protein] synthase-3
MSIRILGTGSYLPEKVMTNEDFEKIIDTSDEWITKRTGIKRRHYVSDGMRNVDMCVIAAGQAMEEAGVQKEDIGGIICGTVTNEMGVPSLAAQVQRALDIEKCIAFDVNAACSGFLFALKTAVSLIKNDGKVFLVIGSETLSRFMNMEDRASCVLFGDGAGAIVIQAGDNLKYLEINSFPDYNHTIEITGMNTKEDGKVVPSIVSLKGKEVYVFSTREAERVLNEAFDATGTSVESVDWFVFHQANARIIKAAAERLNVDLDKCYINIDDVSNTSAASIPIVLDQMNKKGMFKKGDTLAIAAFGGGLTSGSAIYEW